MAVSQHTYVIVALGAFWHNGDLITDGTVFSATRKERITLVAAKSVRDATEEEIKEFRAEAVQSKKQSKSSSTTSTDGDAAKDATKATK